MTDNRENKQEVRYQVRGRRGLCGKCDQEVSSPGYEHHLQSAEHQLTQRCRGRQREAGKRAAPGTYQSRSSTTKRRSSHQNNQLKRVYLRRGGNGGGRERRIRGEGKERRKGRGVVNIPHKPWRNTRFLNYACTTITGPKKDV